MTVEEFWNRFTGKTDLPTMLSFRRSAIVWGMKYGNIPFHWDFAFLALALHWKKLKKEERPKTALKIHVWFLIEQRGSNQPNPFRITAVPVNEEEKAAFDKVMKDKKAPNNRFDSLVERVLRKEPLQMALATVTQGFTPRSPGEEQNKDYKQLMELIKSKTEWQPTDLGLL